MKRISQGHEGIGQISLAQHDDFFITLTFSLSGVGPFKKLEASGVNFIYNEEVLLS